MNGWFSRVNPQTGQVACGAGEIFVDGRSLGYGHMFDWFDGQTLLVKGEGDLPTLINVHTGERQVISDRATDQAAGGGGQWMPAWDGRIWCAVSRTGERAWIEERGGSNDDRGLFVDGLPIVQFQPINYCRIDEGHVTWSLFARGRREIWGKRPGHAPQRLSVFHGDELFAVPVVTSSGPWVVIQSHLGLHVAPWGDSRGTLIQTGNDNNFHPDAQWTPEGLLVVWNDSRGEQGRQLIDLNRRDDLDWPKAVPVPDPDPTEPERPMQYPAAEWEIVKQMHARFASGFTPDEHGGRAFTEMVVQQLAFSFPNGGWCWKRSGPNSDPSKDCTARQIDNRFEGWDILNAAGAQGPRELAQNPQYHDLTGQVPYPRPAKNHLGAAPVPGPVDNGGPISRDTKHAWWRGDDELREDCNRPMVGGGDCDRTPSDPIHQVPVTPPGGGDDGDPGDEDPPIQQPGQPTNAEIMAAIQKLSARFNAVYK